jgi:hypothetical protein
MRGRPVRSRLLDEADGLRTFAAAFEQGDEPEVHLEERVGRETAPAPAACRRRP